MVQVSLQRATPAFLSIGIYLHLYSTCTLAPRLLITHFESMVLQCCLWFPLKFPWRLCNFVDLSTFILSIWLKLSWIFALLPSTCSLQNKVKAINSFSLIVISFPCSLLHKSTDSCFWYVTVDFLISCRMLPKYFFLPDFHPLTILSDFLGRLLCFRWAILTCVGLKYPSPACLVLEPEY